MDRKLYKSQMQHALHNYGPTLSIRTGSVYDLVYSNTHSGSRPEDIRARIEGVRLGMLTLSVPRLLTVVAPSRCNTSIADKMRV